MILPGDQTNPNVVYFEQPMSKKITLELTLSEARGLEAIAGDGAEGILNDEAAARAYVGDSRAQRAAWNALDKLRKALASSEVS